MISTNTAKKEKQASLFSKLEVLLSLKGFLSSLPSKYIKKALIIFIVGILYIANSHFYDRTIRKINLLQEELEMLNVDYTMLKAEYMFDSKRSEIVDRLQPFGIEIPAVPPFVIKSK
jgi:hypothetical protein